MRVLLDQGVPAPLRKHLISHAVQTAHEKGWSTLKNGDLLTVAEREGFDVLLTTDQNLKYQQKLAGRLIAIIVLSTTSWPRIEKSADRIVTAVSRIAAGDFIEVAIPR